MTDSAARPTAWKAVAFAAAGTACFILAFPPFELGALAWFAPWCWIAGVHGARPHNSVLTMALCGYTAFAVGMGWLWNLFQSLALALYAIPAAYIAVWGALLGLRRGMPRAIAVLWPAVVWTGLEYARGEIVPPTTSWLSLGYTQTGAFGAFVASVVGVYGVSFVLVLWGSLLHEAARRWPDLKLARAAFCALAAMPLLALLPLPGPSTEVRGTVALVQLATTDPDRYPTVAPREGGGRLLVLYPEYTSFDDPLLPQSARLLEQMQRAAETATWGLVFGAVEHHTPGDRLGGFNNTAFHVSARGAIDGRAVKNAPVPFMQDGTPAGDVAIFALEAPGMRAKAGCGICYDGSMQRFSRRMAQRGAELLLFPTFNASTWGPVQHRQHQRMFQMRAAETHLPVLTAAQSGPTISVAPGGALLAELPFGETRVLEAPLPRAGTPTLFTHFGWWIGPACMIAALLVGGVAVGRRAAQPRRDGENA